MGIFDIFKQKTKNSTSESISHTEDDIRILSEEHYEEMRIEDMCMQIDALREKEGIRDAYEKWSSNYHGGVGFNYEALVNGDGYRRLFNMTENDLKSMFGCGSIEYLWQNNLIWVKLRCHYRLSLPFYHYVGLKTCAGVEELVENLTQMDGEDAAIWSRRGASSEFS